MESARRASIVHQKRTGRALRITEADVINEEMYEEVNDLPTEYRRLNAHLQTRNADFDQRLLAYLSCQMATRQAVSHCWQNEQSLYDSRGVGFGTQQEPYSHGLSASPAAEGMIGHRQAPYTPVAQDVLWRQHDRPASSAATYAPGIDQQRPRSSFGSPLVEGRHMSLPSDTTMQPPWHNSNVSMEPPSSNTISRTDSAVDMAGNFQYLQHPALGKYHDLKSSPQSYQAQHGHPVEPMSTTLPLDSQQFFPSSPQAFDFHTGHHHISSPSQEFSNRRYSYNPNGKRKSTPSSLPHFYTDHFAAPTRPGHASSSPSPLRPDINPGSRPSALNDGALSQACHDAGVMGPDITFPVEAPK
jgi:hypothetical protein